MGSAKQMIMDNIRYIEFFARQAVRYASAGYSAVDAVFSYVWGAPPHFFFSELSEEVPDLDKFGNTLLARIVALSYLYRVTGSLKHTTISIIGPMGVGKTTYAVDSIIGAYIYLGYGVDKAVSNASRLLFTNPYEFVEVLDKLVKDRSWVPAMILDDVGSEISKYWLFIGERYWAHLFRVIEHAKDWCGVLILTAKTYESIPSKLREISDYIVEAEQIVDPGSSSVVILFKYYESNMYRKRVRGRGRPVYIDAMPPTAKIPDDIWNTMLSARRDLSIRSIEAVKEAITKSLGVEGETQYEEATPDDEHQG